MDFEILNDAYNYLSSKANLESIDIDTTVVLLKCLSILHEELHELAPHIY